MSALEQLRNGKTGREKSAETRRNRPFSIKRLLPVSVENIAFSRLVPGKQPLNLSMACRLPGNTPQEARTMTETEKKALALVNAVCAEWEVSPATEDEMDGSACFAALIRAIEQHEAFRQEVSDAVELRFSYFRGDYGCLSRFVLTKPDPLEAAMQEAGCAAWPDVVTRLRAALAARGLEVRKIGEGE